MDNPLKMNPEQLLQTTTAVDRINKELKAKKLAPKNDLDKDAFLRLLTKQLSKQDPLSPMSNTDFIAQMAQFTALEQMKNMNTSMTALKQNFSKMQVLSMIGSRVNYLDEKSGKIVSGEVQKVLMQSDGAKLHINGDDVSLNALVSVEGSARKNSPEQISNQISSSRVLTNMPVKETQPVSVTQVLSSSTAKEIKEDASITTNVSVPAAAVKVK